MPTLPAHRRIFSGLEDRLNYLLIYVTYLFSKKFVYPNYACITPVGMLRVRRNRRAAITDGHRLTVCFQVSLKYSSYSTIHKYWLVLVITDQNDFINSRYGAIVVATIKSRPSRDAMGVRSSMYRIRMTRTDRVTRDSSRSSFQTRILFNDEHIASASSSVAGSGIYIARNLK